MIDTVRHDYFSIIDTEDKAYFLGLMLADGAINKRREEYTIVSLHMSQKDIDIVEKFKRYIETSNKIFIGHTFNDCAIRVTSRRMVSDLANNGITAKKTGSEDPKNCRVPDELIRHFVRGIIEGDGWYSISHTRYDKIVASVGVCGSYETCFYVQALFAQLLCTRLLNPSKVKDKDCYKIGYQSLRDAKSIIEYLYYNATVYINRKRDNALQIMRLQ